MAKPDWRTWEETAFACWPALEQTDWAAGVLRASDGYTKRANSANVLVDINEGVDAVIAEGRAFFERRSLRPVFRLLSAVNHTALDRRLAELGLAKVEPSLVMTMELSRSAAGSPAKSSATADWMQAYAELSGNVDDPGHAKHRRMLDRLPTSRLLLVQCEGDRAIACGIGVIHRETVCLLDILVHPACRGRGVGQALVRDILSWAAAQSARWAMLQVLGTNIPAVRLYTRAGFERAYGYFYRVDKMG